MPRVCRGCAAGVPPDRRAGVRISSTVEVQAGETVDEESGSNELSEPEGSPEPSTWDATKVVLFEHRHKIVLGALMWLWWLTFYRLGALRHDRYGTFGFDLAIFDQASWLVSQFKDPFMTVRGLDVFGHHGNFVFYLFAPFYWLGAGPHFLLAAQLASQLAGVAGIYLLARDRLEGNRWIAAMLASSMMLHPTMQFLAWEFFHPESFAIGPIILAYWAGRQERWRLFWAMAILAMACKEDVTFVFIMLGILMMFRKQVRVGAWVSGVAIAWYLAVTKLIIPWRNPAGPFYEEHFFSNYGGSIGSVVKTVIRHPSRLWRDLNEAGRVDFYVKMWAPVAFVCFLSPQTMLLALPMIMVIVLASIPWVQDYRYHYMAIPLAITFIATVEAIAAVRNRSRRNFLVGAVLTASLFGSAMWGVSPFSRHWDDGYWPRAQGESYMEVLLGLQQDNALWPKVAAKNTAVGLVPSNGSVSASYNVVPHVSGRAYAYEWPNPWIGTNWGICNDNLDDPATVDWIIVDRDLFGDQAQPDLLNRLLETEFEIRYERDNVVLAERVQPPSGPPPLVLTECG